VGCVWIEHTTGPYVDAFSLHLSWTDNSLEEDDFQVEFSPDGVAWQDLWWWGPIPGLPGAGSRYQNTDGILGPEDVDKIRYVRVRAHRHSDDAFSPYSEVAACTRRAVRLRPVALPDGAAPGPVPAEEVEAVRGGVAGQAGVDATDVLALPMPAVRLA